MVALIKKRLLWVSFSHLIVQLCDCTRKPTELISCAGAERLFYVVLVVRTDLNGIDCETFRSGDRQVAFSSVNKGRRESRDLTQSPV